MFSQARISYFVKVEALPPYQDKLLHLMDAIDYAANASVVPVVAAMGQKDPYFPSHVLMEKAIAREGVSFVGLVSPETGHAVDPATHRDQLKRLGEYAARGIDRSPKHVRFVTWTLKYNRCHWVEVLGLEEHYRRAEINVQLAEDSSVTMAELKNITRFALLPPALQGPTATLRVGGMMVPLPQRQATDPPRTVVVERREGQWQYQGSNPASQDGKRPGLHGPIDDAFATSFLCVRGTGPAWHPALGAWSEASLKRFAYEWARYYRGDLPLKDDTELTAEDLRRSNLILFGDPGSNRWITKVLPSLPVQWTRDDLRIGKERYPAADHGLMLIFPNPLPGAEGRYVVLNSGHTFREKEIASLSYLVFPRLGDWAVVKVGGNAPNGPSKSIREEVVQSGFFDEQWRLPDKTAR